MIYHSIPSGLNLDELAKEYIISCKQNCVNHMGKGAIGDGGLVTDRMNGNVLRSYNKVYGYLGRLITGLVDYHEKEPNQFKPMFAFALQDEFRGYDKVNRFLEKMKIIEIRDDYSVTATRFDKKKGFPKGYRLRVTFRRMKATKQPVIMKQVAEDIAAIEGTSFANKDVVPKEEVDQAVYKFIKEGIKIEMTDWKMWEISESKLRSIKINLTKLAQGIVAMKRSNIVNRMHHVISNMPVEGRRFIKLKDGRSFASVDISCSHLFQMVCLYEPHTPEVQKLIDSDLYVVLADAVGVDRTIIKSQVMKYLYSGSKPKEISEAMKMIFPNVHNFVMEDAENKYPKRARRAKKVSHEMMSLESEFITAEISSQLLTKGIEFFTIHDAAYVPCDKAIQTRDIMLTVYSKQAGLVPRVKIEEYR